MKRDYCIPFDPKSGTPISYAGYDLTDEQEAMCNEQGELLSDNGNILWRANKPFTATMRYVGYGRGRSSAYFIFEDWHGIQHTMFLADADEMILRGIDLLHAQGKFSYIKRGCNYGLKFRSKN